MSAVDLVQSRRGLLSIFRRRKDAQRRYGPSGRKSEAESVFRSPGEHKKRNISSKLLSSAFGRVVVSVASSLGVMGRKGVWIRASNAQRQETDWRLRGQDRRWFRMA